MTQLEEKDLDKLMKLCRIECTEAEKKKFLISLKRVLSYIDLLQEVPTEGIRPCYQVLEGVANVLREDMVGPTLPRDEFLANAPSHVGGMVRVPPVIKSTNS